MKTEYTIYFPDGTSEPRDIDWPEEPGYERIAKLVESILGGNLEHVTVLHNGKRADMFVHETGAIDRLPRNEAATAIYRANWLSQNPGTREESLPAIYGPAVLFDRIVWV